MSNQPVERLYSLLPAIYRQRDAASGEPLRALLAIAEDELRVLDDGIARLYDNWFIETCDDWAVPYLAELLGIAGLADTPRGGFVPRAFVAGAIGFLRRKGVPAVLAEVAAAASGWPARVVEYYALLAMSQHLENIQIDRGRTVDLRDREALRLIGSPLDSTARRPDMRAIGDGIGRHNLPNIGLFLCRLQTYPLVDAPAANLGSGVYSFDPLGAERQLFTRPASGVSGAEELYADLPLPLTAALLAADLDRARRTGQSALIGRGGSLRIVVDGVELQPAQLAAVAPNAPAATPVAVIDPERGLFSLNREAGEVRVSFSYGAPADIGGGPYDRRAALAAYLEWPWQASVGPGEAYADLSSALDAWADYCNSAPAPHKGAIVIADSGRYTLNGSIILAADADLAIVAASGARPAIRILADGDSAQAPIPLTISAAEPYAALALDGLLIAAAGVQLFGAINLTLADCSLLPTYPGDILPPVEASSAGVKLTARRCVLGPLRFSAGAHVSLSDTVIAAAGAPAVEAPDAGATGPDLSLVRCTLLGGLRAGALSAQDSIIDGTLVAESGELRFCYAPPTAGLNRWRCQPDLARESAGLARANGEPGAPSDEQVLDRVRPRFTSGDYLNPAYAQLAAEGPPEIATGAEDGAELGVYHDLFQPQRMNTLHAVVSGFLPVGAELGVRFIT